MQDRLRMLALRAVRARAEYVEAVNDLAKATNPLGITVERYAQLEAVIDDIASDENTNFQELDAIAAVANGLQH